MDATCADEQLTLVIQAGELLSPLFWHDPCDGEVQDAYTALRNLDTVAAAQEWPFVDFDEARSGLELMKRDLSQPKGLEDIAQEYRRLFVGPFKKATPPWGSVYTDRECVVFGASTLALRSWMREHGVAWHADDRTPEDHIGLMLALMAWVAANRSELLDEYMRDHLLTWAPHFLDEVESAAEDDFYRGLAALTRATLEGIRAARGIEVHRQRFYR
jgi:TorA maturation chaperone TorD